MLESKDPAIKLFGKKIPFPAADEKLKSGGDRDGEVEEEDKSAEKEGTSMEKATEGAEEEISESMEKENHEDSKSKGEDEDEDENSKEMEKPLKKPSKILPCPRCNSMDTKFCYYNNYNINQPRHFCKACQRYWTAGGTMRNVPVGAGRRKNKNLSSHYRHISISEALQASRIDSTHPGLKTNGRILSFGLEAQHAPICDSMASVLKLRDQKVLINGAKNRFHSSGDQRVMARIENGDDCSSVTSINNQSTDESRSQNCRVPEANMNGFACIPNVPWPYTWNPSIPPPAFFPPPGFPMPFYPYWSIPMASPQISSSGQKGLHPPGSNSPTLGKHSRDEERNGCVLVPKTLRVDDPKEAAKSSIWTTLGIKNERMSKGGMFKGFDQKTNNKTVDTSPLLRANPAALSRSIDFHERI